ncbi:MAG TPA: D-alanyl carrier protein [Lachnospiraceae bacterium]|nr:phosphopantetheine-binding protein [uncultured Lachnoclostridium sp.]HAU87129.1 D-alanyl carrier protein [Lachnospiraceae bacterium]
MIEQILESIRKSLEEILGEEGEKKELEANMDLINDIGLDSLQLVNVILDLEEQYDLNIDFDEFDFDKVQTIQELAEYIKELSGENE